MPTHDIDFSQGDPLPICRRCGKPMDAETWARDERCLGAPTSFDRLRTLLAVRVVK